MSVSSGGDSLCGDDEADLLLDEEEDVDLYAILNVPRNATDDDIIKAYHRRCLMFHPDRFMDETDKRDAERVFVQVRRAHEVLMDPKQRAIYDALGVQGLDTQGWELVSRSANPDSIRREYEFLQRLKDRELMLQRVHPTSGFVVKTSFAGLFHEEPEERYAPQLVGMALTQSVDCGLTGVDRVGIVGRVKTGNGRGDGNIALIWKRAAGKYNIENSCTISADSVGLSVRAARNVFQRAAIIVQPQLQYSFLHETFLPSVLFIYSMRLRARWQGSIILNVSPLQSAITTTMVHTSADTHQPKAVINITLSPANSNVRLAYYQRRPDRDSFTEAAIQLTMYGVSPSVAIERRLTRFSRVGVSLMFSFPSCLLAAKFKLKTGQSSFEWQCTLCDDKDALARSVVYGVAAPYFAVQVAKWVFRSWWERLAAALSDDGANGKHGVDTEKREEAANVTSLMRPTAERIRREETSRHGVVIIEARYGQCAPGATKDYPLAADNGVDVTVPLQAMVNDSQLRVYATAKHQLPGFYDPCPGESKVLSVRYMFRDEPHAVTVGDEQPLMLPLRAHRINPD